MKKSLLKYLISPLKKEKFKTIVFKKEDIQYNEGFTGEEIIDGILLTESGEWYPIINGIPRILLGELKLDLFKYYPEFIKNYSEKIKKHVDFKKTEEHMFSEINKETISKFGFQWNQFDDMDSGLNYKDWMSNAVDHNTFFKNKLGIEVGSGAGGHTLKTLGYGAEVIATDLSHAIDVTYKKIKNYRKSHSIQADLYHLPFKEKSADFLYCLGVLQHLPDPEKGFNEMSKYVKRQGSYFTNLYSNTRKAQLFVEDSIRFFIKPLPNRAILVFAHFFNLLDHLLQIWPYKLLKSTKLKKLFLSRTDIYSKLGYRKSLDDWFDRLSAPIIKRYPKKDLERWYIQSGFKDICVYDFNNSNWVGYGVAN